MSEPETCLGCGRKVADDAAWKRPHDDDRCGDGCWCAAYCWLDASCVPNPANIRAIARAEAFEECARIADAYFPQDFPNDISRTCEGIAADIRRRIKP